MKIAAIYARVSSDRQKEDQTIASQTAALRAYAAEVGLEVPADWIFEDEGISGATLLRPALERLRDLVAQLEVPVLLCYSPDRLARKYAYQALLMEEFARSGTEVQFLKGPKADTPEDELLLQFQGMIAEYEKAQISERTRRGKVHRARSGSPAVLSGAPYGYRYVRKREHAEAQYEILEPEATVVRELFRRYTEDVVSIGELARSLTVQGIPTAKGKRTWDRSTVWGILRNPAYCGRAAFGKTRVTDRVARVTRPVRLKGIRGRRRTADEDRPREDWIEIAVPALVSDDVFEAAQRRLQENKHFSARNTKEPSLLQGLVACQSCGYGYYRTSTRTRARKLHYYRCLGSDDYRYENGRICANRPVRQDYLDDVVWQHITALLSDPRLIRVELDRRLEEVRKADPAAAQRSRVELQLVRGEKAVRRLVDAYQAEIVTLEELRERMPKLRREDAALRAQLADLEAQQVDRETYLKLAEGLEDFLIRLRESAERPSMETRQRTVRLLVKEVLVGPERVVIRHSIPTAPSGPTGGYLLRGRGPFTTSGERAPRRSRQGAGEAGPCVCALRRRL